MEQRIIPNLWFHTQAEEAAVFYCSVFKNSQMTNVTHYGDAGPGPAGTVMTVEVERGRPALRRHQRWSAVPLHRGRVV